MFVFSCLSGGYFVTQTAILTVLLESLEKSNKTNKKIDFYFGNSGGAISNLISLQYSKEKESIERASKGGSKSQTLTRHNQPAAPPNLKTG